MADKDKKGGDHAHDHGHEHGHDHDGHGHGHDENADTSNSNGTAARNNANTAADHGHTHEHMEHAGHFQERERPRSRSFGSRAFTVGIGGPVGSGKTAMMLQLCRALRGELSVVAITNDIFTREDGQFLTRNDALPRERIIPIETGGCPHAAIRDDVTANLVAAEEATVRHGADVILLESGGDNLAANFSRELADYTIYVIDVAGGDKVPRKGGPGITQSDLLVINKTDLAEAVGADLAVMDRDAKLMRGSGPTVFAQVKHGDGMELILSHIKSSLNAVPSASKKPREA
mmetsp:Transcript_19537/g.59109  ORF Transcript_19537/g.59109 Transcript_19537/m.59109 type:complete len:289 (-) Transcript_19537:1051-1917(-)